MEIVIQVPLTLTLLKCKHCEMRYSVIAHVERENGDNDYWDQDPPYCPRCGKEK